MVARLSASVRGVIGHLVVAAIAVASIGWLQNAVSRLPRPPILERIDTDTPVIARLAMAAGDPYLAANGAAFRGLIANLGKLDAVSLELLAKVHEDASRLNPAHADNYYVAQGTLPWATRDGRFADLNDRILRRASESRASDFMPDFFLGINAWYFRLDYDSAGRHFQRAGDKSPPPAREQMYGLAAGYFDKVDNVESARRILRHLREGMTNPQERRLIDLRLARLDGLETLQRAAARFRDTTGHPPATLDELVSAGLLRTLPADPLAIGYTLDEKGIPRLGLRTKEIPLPLRTK